MGTMQRLFSDDILFVGTLVLGVYSWCRVDNEKKYATILFIAFSFQF